MFNERYQSKTMLPSLKVSPSGSRNQSFEKPEYSSKKMIIGNKKYTLKLPSVSKLNLIV
jgi:hypothetical protein